MPSEREPHSSSREHKYERGEQANLTSQEFGQETKAQTIDLGSSELPPKRRPSVLIVPYDNGREYRQRENARNVRHRVPPPVPQSRNDSHRADDSRAKQKARVL